MVRTDSTVIVGLLLGLARGLEEVSGIHAIVPVILEDGDVVFCSHFLKTMLGIDGFCCSSRVMEADVNLVGGVVYEETCCAVREFGRFPFPDGNSAGCVALQLIARYAITWLEMASLQGRSVLASWALTCLAGTTCTAQRLVARANATESFAKIAAACQSLHAIQIQVSHPLMDKEQ